MSANRKLQTEIDRVLKKVEEGVEIFDDTWDKVYSASQQSLKEKYEGDLKKEIKKLQRLRDQIKTWIGSNDIRDKSALIDTRKLIETKMEQFKICEKETKTKAYSKEGLARSEMLDPHEQLKQDKRDWLQECIDKLTELVDSTEADIERLSSLKGRKNKEEAETLEAKVAKHRHHISKLEQIMRVLDNDSLDPNRVDDVKDDVEYYIERATDEDDEIDLDDEFDIYEELGLDDLTAQLLAAPIERPRLPSDSKQNEETEAEVEATDAADARDASGEEKSGGSSGAKAKKSTPNTLSSLTSIGRPQRKAEKSKPAPAPVAAPAAAVAKSVAATSAPPAKFSAVAQKKDLKTPTTPIASQLQPGTTMASALQNSVRQAPPASPAAVKAGTGSPLMQAKPAPLAAQVVQQNIPRPQDGPTAAAVAAGKAVPASPQRAPVAQPSPQMRPQQTPSPQLPPAATPFGAESPRPLVGMSEGQVPQRSIFNNPEIAAAAAMLRTSMSYAPPVQETDRSKAYHPRNPAPCHPSFPTMPAPILDNPALFEKLPADTLFFIFYFQQGTFQQYLAARQLKKHSWRFHKKYSTWFQRHEEPKISAEEYEEGTYVYFDYESGWCQRIKSEFKFEYAFLEDELAV